MLAPPALALAGAGLGFLVWNWHPARIFLGDVGSVPLGYLAGWLLLGAVLHGLWLPALILPLYYLADGGLTLARRLVRGERVWEGHREHFYQRAVHEGGLGHAGVVRRVVLANVVLLAAAAAALGLGAPALLPAGLAVGVLLRHLGRGAARPARAMASPRGAPIKAREGRARTACGGRFYGLSNRTASRCARPRGEEPCRPTIVGEVRSLCPRPRGGTGRRTRRS